MTLQQLKYVVEVAERGSITEAAKSLFIAQPSLSAAIRDLEEETGTTIFLRNSRGILLTQEGVEFLGYARQVVQQAALIEDKYIAHSATRQRFSVSTQHYSFTSSAFVELVRVQGGKSYEFILREGKTYDTMFAICAVKWASFTFAHSMKRSSKRRFANRISSFRSFFLPDRIFLSDGITRLRDGRA